MKEKKLKNKVRMDMRLERKEERVKEVKKLMKTQGMFLFGCCCFM